MLSKSTFIFVASFIGVYFCNTLNLASAQDRPDQWLERFVDELDPASQVAGDIDDLGADRSREQVIRTAASHFRSRVPLTGLWVVPFDVPATAEDRQRADKAIDHIITERSGEFALPDNLPWFDAPDNFPTLSRFPHFDYLARSYSDSGDERYAEAIVRDILDFIEHVDIAESVNFTVQSPLNLNPWNWVLLQWRVKRWIDVLAHLRSSPSLSDENYLRFLQYIWDEVDWLVPNKNLGLHNGTLGNGSAILYTALHYPEAKSAEAWLDDAEALLDSFLDLAFYPGEFLIELTLGYSEGTLLMCSAMFEALPDSDRKKRISEKLEAIFDAHVGMMKPDRSIPRYGDHGIYDIRARILRKGHELFGRSDMLQLADQLHISERADGRLSFPFESNPYYLSGYYAMRNGWDTDAQYLSMDAGPFGTNHHHGDKLSITVSADGANFIVDPGTSLYRSTNPGPRIDLRPGYLHNVITIDGIDPNTGWDRHYGFDVLENRWVTNSEYDFLEGTYEFRNNLLDAMWRRSVFYVKGDYWIVLDAIYGDGEHLVESNLQFMIGNDVEVAADRIVAKAPNGASLDIVQVFGDGLDPAVVIGDTVSSPTTFITQYPGFVDWVPGGRGWVGMFGNESPMDAAKSYPAPALLKTGKVEFPFKTVTVLTPSIDKSPRTAKVRIVDESSERFTISIETGSGSEDFYSWKIADWPHQDQKVEDDSGWWARTIDGIVHRVVVMNEDSITVNSAVEEIHIQFDGRYEGRVDRTADGWTITPDLFDRAPPNVLHFTVTTGGTTASYRIGTSGRLVAGKTHSLVPN